MKIKPIKTEYWDDYDCEYPFISNEELTLEYDNRGYEVVLLVEGPKITIAAGDLDFFEIDFDLDTDEVYFQAEFYNDLEAIAFVTEMPSEFTDEWLVQEGFIDLNDIDKEETEEETKEETEEKANDKIRKWFTWQKNLIYLIVLLSLWGGFKFFDHNDLKGSIMGFFGPVAVLFFFWIVGGQLYHILKPLLIWLDKKVFIPLWDK